MSQRNVYFFLGTVAELIKVMPVMQELSARGVAFQVISSGQNRIVGSELFDLPGMTQVDIVINDRPIKKSAAGLLAWFLETLVKAFKLLRPEFRRAGPGSTLIVHGDTVSTLMGAFVGKTLGLRVAHVEAGLRSHNFLQPFPEEIDRYLTAYFTDIHFAPYAEAVANLRHRRGAKIDTGYNTNIDSLTFALAENRKPALLDDAPGKYFIFIMHRQENLLNAALVREIVGGILCEARELACVFVMHDLTRTVLRDLDLLEVIENNPNIVVAGRLPYLDFVGLLAGSEFIMTDGGGNQQETYYLGKPCLIMRGVTEGTEGIGGNVVISMNDPATIRKFMETYDTYRTPSIRPVVPPSTIVVDALTSA